MNRNKKRGSKGVSPVIATVLLIAMVIVIGLIIFLWFRGLTKEAVTKFEENIELVCEDVDFISDYSSTTGILSLSNTGNVPIYSFKIKVFRVGEHETFSLENIDSSWPKTGLKQGGAFSSQDLSDDFYSAEKILVTPVLLGTSQTGGKKIHVCDENYGYEIPI